MLCIHETNIFSLFNVWLDLESDALDAHDAHDALDATRDDLERDTLGANFDTEAVPRTISSIPKRT